MGSSAVRCYRISRSYGLSRLQTTAPSGCHLAEETSMDLLWTIAVILIILWLLGMVTSFTVGGFIHILLVLAIIVILIRVIQGRRAI
jgi:hypothetical protein